MDASAPNPTDSTEVTAFIDRWRPGGGSERSNYQLFLTELCDLLAVEHPDPASPDNAENRYVFERAITRSQPDKAIAAEGDKREITCRLLTEGERLYITCRI